MRHKFWITWTYIGNYSTKPVYTEAANETEAVKAAFAHYGEEFKAKAKFFVTSEAPVCLAAGEVWPSQADDAKKVTS